MGKAEIEDAEWELKREEKTRTRNIITGVSLIVISILLIIVSYYIMNTSTTFYFDEFEFMFFTFVAFVLILIGILALGDKGDIEHKRNELKCLKSGGTFEFDEDDFEYKCR